MFVVEPGNPEVRGKVLQANDMNQCLTRSQTDGPAGQAGVVLRRHNLQQRPLGTRTHIQRQHPIAPPAVHPVAVIILKVLDLSLRGRLPPHLLQVRHGVPGLPVQILEELDVVGEHLIHGPVQADVQADGSGHRHQNHGGEDADIGQTHGVLLHAVEQSGDSGKVICLVVKIPVGPQPFQQSDGPGGKQAVSAHHHQSYCRKEKGHGHDGAFHGKGEAVAPQQGREADEHQQPLGPGFPLSGVLAVKQFYRLGTVQLKEVPAKRQGHQRGKEDGRLADPRQTDGKAEQHGQAGHFQNHQQHQFGQENAREDPPHDDCGGAQQRLPAHHQSDVALFQAQNVIQAQLLLPPLHNEAVGVEQDHSGKEGHHKAAHVAQGLEVHGTPDGLQGLMSGEEAENVVHSCHAAAGEKVRPVVPPVPGQIHQSQPGKEAGLTHGTHRLVPIPSACRRCGGTGTPGFLRPGRAGGIPARPAGTAPVRRGWQPLPSESPLKWSAPLR